MPEGKRSKERRGKETYDAQHPSVPLRPTILGVFDLLLFAKLFDEEGGGAEVVTGDSGEEMMSDLFVKA
jgi:hypothetical protein